jgi:hypothetical protein
VDDSLFFEIEPQRVKKANLFIRKQNAILNDDVFAIKAASEKDFYQVQKITTYDDNINTEEGALAAIYIRLDN